MVVKDSRQAGGLEDGASDPVGSRRDDVPLIRPQPVSRSDSSGLCGPLRHLRGRVGQNEHGPPIARCREQARGPGRERLAGGVGACIRQRDGDERAGERQTSRGQFVALPRRIRRQKPPVAELGSFESGGGNLVEHLRRRRRVAARLELQHAP